MPEEEEEEQNRALFDKTRRQMRRMAAQMTAQELGVGSSEDDAYGQDDSYDNTFDEEEDAHY